MVLLTEAEIRARRNQAIDARWRELDTDNESSQRVNDSGEDKEELDDEFVVEDSDEGYGYRGGRKRSRMEYQDNLPRNKADTNACYMAHKSNSRQRDHYTAKSQTFARGKSNARAADCDGNDTEYDTYIRRERWRLEREAEDRIALIECLEQWREGCIHCRLVYKDEVEYRDHDWEECCHGGIDQIKVGLNKIKKEEKEAGDGLWSDTMSCSLCHLPKEVCNRWVHAPGRGWCFIRRGSCVYGDILMKTMEVKRQLEYQDMISWMKQQVKKEGLREHEVVKWLGMGAKIAGWESNNLLQVFMKFVLMRSEDD